MPNVNFTFINSISQPLSSGSVILSPITFPVVSGSAIIVGDQIYGTTNLTGTASFSNIVVPNYYKLDFKIIRDTTTYYCYLPASNIDLNGGNYSISCSIQNGDATDVYFNLKDCTGQSWAIKNVILSPVFFPNVNNSRITTRDEIIFTTDANGSTTFPKVIPNTYMVTCNGHRRSTVFFIKVPAYAGSVNAKDIMVLPTAQQLQNINIPPFSFSIGLTEEEANNLYQTIIQTGSFFNINVTNSISASFASSSISASYAKSSSISNRSISSSYSDTSKQVSFGDPNNLINSSILVRGQGGCLISMGEQNLLNQITVAGMSIYDETLSSPDDEIIRISPSVTWFSGSNNFGIGTSSPDADPNNKLQVSGNIICSNITASTLLGNLVSNDHNLTIDNNGLSVGSGDELVNIDSNKVDVAGVIQLSNQGLSVGFSSPDITTISNGKINALRITSSLYGTASWALNAVNAISSNSTENAEFAISATNSDLATLALTSNTASAVLQVNADSLIKLNVDRPNLGPTSPILLLSASNHDVGAYNADAIDISNENYTEVFHYEVDGNFYILGNAKTGLGTDNPTEKVHIVSGSILAEGNYPQLTLRNSDISTVLTTADLTISDVSLGSLAMAITSPDTYINFYDANGYIVNLSTNGHSYITNSFNFGIGTQTPTEKLEVIGNILCNNITASNLFGNVISSDHNLTIDNSGLSVGSGDELVNIDSNKVDVAGVIRLSNAGLTAGFSSPDITTISNGKVTALHITASTITGSIHATPQTAGTVALSGGMALVSTNAVNTNSKIFLTSQTGDAGNLWVGDRTNGASFQITSSTSNTHNIAWFIIN